MPCSASQVSTERVRTRSMAGSSRSRLTISSVRTVPASIFDLSERVTASAVIRPLTRVSRYERLPAPSGTMPSIQMPRVEPQSSSRTMSSWATSTSRRVR